LAGNGRSDAELPPRQATGSLITTFGKERKLPLAKKSLKAKFDHHELTDYAVTT
jgi:hypothetical protein